VKEEMAFLRYRREVVQGWPESPRKAAFLTAIESRIARIQKEWKVISSAMFPTTRDA
jgi:hypothetical protein